VKEIGMEILGQLLRKYISRTPFAVLLIFAVLLPLWMFEWSPSDAAMPTTAELQMPDVATIPVDIEDTLPPAEIKRITVGKGDTLMALLVRAGLPRTDSHHAIKALSKKFSPKRIRPGQEIELTFEPAVAVEGKDSAKELNKLVVRPDIYKEYVVRPAGEGRFKAVLEKKAVETKLSRAEGSIDNSLYVSATKAGVPVPVLMEMIRIFSWDVDFQRGIRTGDKFEIMFERLFTDKGEFARYGRVLYANLILRGDQRPLYRYRTTKGTDDYFDEKGRSARKALMRTPINGARLSSGYGRRRHPILGYTKMHRGADFAAPRGTPIYAGGSGTVVYRARKGGYGNYIRIRHNSEYSTAYAHMKSFARKVRRGSRVRQGQVIGYVGSTGRSTGPHLHYEILRRGRQVNPMRIKMPSGKHLKGKELTRFTKVRDKLDVTYASLPAFSKVARK